MDTSIAPAMDPRKREVQGHDSLRHDGKWQEIMDLYAAPFGDVIYQAQSVHRNHFAPNRVQLSELLSIKTGGCAEDCAYCPQCQKYAAATGVKAEKIMSVDTVLASAKKAKASGATRFCMGAAWSRPKDHDLEPIAEMIKGVRELGLETCMTLGMLSGEQAGRLASAGLDYYNHNIDTSEEYYREIITTRSFAERIETLSRVRAAGIKVCCGGIVGMGESREDRASMLAILAGMDPHPESVPINMLVRVGGTPLAGADTLDPFEFVRTIAIARILMPRTYVRLSAGRQEMSDEAQALAFLAGANSIFTGDKLLTTGNPGKSRDAELFERLGIRTE